MNLANAFLEISKNSAKKQKAAQVILKHLVAYFRVTPEAKQHPHAAIAEQLIAEFQVVSDDNGIALLQKLAANPDSKNSEYIKPNDEIQAFETYLRTMKEPNKLKKCYQNLKKAMLDLSQARGLTIRQLFDEAIIHQREASSSAMVATEDGSTAAATATAGQAIPITGKASDAKDSKQHNNESKPLFLWFCGFYRFIVNDNLAHQAGGAEIIPKIRKRLDQLIKSLANVSDVTQLMGEVALRGLIHDIFSNKEWLQRHCKKKSETSFFIIFITTIQLAINPDNTKTTLQNTHRLLKQLILKEGEITKEKYTPADIIQVIVAGYEHVPPQSILTKDDEFKRTVAHIITGLISHQQHRDLYYYPLTAEQPDNDYKNADHDTLISLDSLLQLPGDTSLQAQIAQYSEQIANDFYDRTKPKEQRFVSHRLKITRVGDAKVSTFKKIPIEDWHERIIRTIEHLINRNLKEKTKSSVTDAEKEQLNKALALIIIQECMVMELTNDELFMIIERFNFDLEKIQIPEAGSAFNAVMINRRNTRVECALGKEMIKLFNEALVLAFKIKAVNLHYEFSLENITDIVYAEIARVLLDHPADQLSKNIPSALLEKLMRALKISTDRSGLILLVEIAIEINSTLSKQHGLKTACPPADSKAAIKEVIKGKLNIDYVAENLTDIQILKERKQIIIDLFAIFIAPAQGHLLAAISSRSSKCIIKDLKIFIADKFICQLSSAIATLISLRFDNQNITRFNSMMLVHLNMRTMIALTDKNRKSEQDDLEQMQLALNQYNQLLAMELDADKIRDTNAGLRKIYLQTLECLIIDGLLLKPEKRNLAPSYRDIFFSMLDDHSSNMSFLQPLSRMLKKYLPNILMLLPRNQVDAGGLGLVTVKCLAFNDNDFVRMARVFESIKGRVDFYSPRLTINVRVDNLLPSDIDRLSVVAAASSDKGASSRVFGSMVTAEVTARMPMPKDPMQFSASQAISAANFKSTEMKGGGEFSRLAQQFGFIADQKNTVATAAAEDNQCHNQVLKDILVIAHQFGETFKVFVELVTRKEYPKALRSICNYLKVATKSDTDAAIQLIEILASKSRYLVNFDVNERTGKDGRAAIHYAAMANCHKAVQVLVDCGADLNLRELNGQKRSAAEIFPEFQRATAIMPQR